jgi:hypothetical protein
MAGKITVNGVDYDGIEAMPPEARKLYEQALARVPLLADRDGDGVPDVIATNAMALHGGQVVQKTIVVNGVHYDDERTMPPDVLEVYERAMRFAAMAGPSAHKDSIQMSFHLKGPHLDFRLGHETPLATGDASLPPSLAHALRAPGAVTGGRAKPIEPSSGGAGVRVALVLAACLATGLALWLWLRAH